MVMRIAALVVTSACLAADAIRKHRSESKISGPQATASLGNIYGITESCDQFLGIPYAEPPLNDLRFADPEPWTTPYGSSGLDAKTKPQKCISTLNTGDEDCLYLNVFRPSGVLSDEKLPVMVWVHGGAFIAGEAADAMYMGCNLANNQHVIVVSMNYRLNIFGFGTFENADGSISTNWAMEDQREALRWVQTEIGAFGGDSSRVTLFGESAGGISIWHHLVTEKSRGLFHRAIIQSGFPTGKATHVALNITAEMGAKVRCSGSGPSLRACMRGKSASSIQRQDTTHNVFGPDIRLFQRWEPVQDGVELAEHPYKILQNGGSFANMPLILGSNTDEGHLFTWLLWLLPVSDRAYRGVINEVWSNIPNAPSKELNQSEIDLVFRKYPPADRLLADNRESVSNQISDSMFHCNTRFGGRYHGERSPTWTYQFNYRSENCKWIYPISGVPGVFHAYEIAYMFGNIEEAYGKALLRPTGCNNMEDAGNELSSRMMEYWGNLARTGNPNGGSLMEWPQYDAASKREIVFEGTDRVATDFRGTYCEFWENLVYSKVL